MKIIRKQDLSYLPGGGAKDLNTAINIMVYTLVFIAIRTCCQQYFGLDRLRQVPSLLLICGVLFLATNIQFNERHDSIQKARRIMFGSFHLFTDCADYIFN